MATHLPIIAIEVVLVLGGTLAFVGWQLRDLARERRRADERKRALAAPSTAERSAHAGGTDPEMAAAGRADAVHAETGHAEAGHADAEQAASVQQGQRRANPEGGR